MLHPVLNNKIIDKLATPGQIGDFGVELEIEGLHLPDTVAGWKVKPENSLRNQSQGGPGQAMEYVLHGAMSKPELSLALQRLYLALTKTPAQAILTQRASTHLHINMQYQTFKTYFGFLMLFSIIEPLLVRICGPHRNGNLFCLPSYETGELSFVAGAQAKNILDGSYGNWRNRGKYACLNTDPLRQFGSVEVRCFPNCIIPNEILQWAQWLLNIRTICANWDDETFAGLFEAAVDNPNGLASQVFGSSSLFSAAQGNNVSELIQMGAETGYEVFRATKKVFVYNEEEWKAKKKRGRKSGFEASSSTDYEGNSLADLVEEDM